MKRDMDLIRLILLRIEEQYRSTAIYDLSVVGYDKETIAYHCKILHEAGLIADYKAQYGDNQLQHFGISGLTWAGHDYLDKIRDDSIWRKTKDAIAKKGLPLILETVKTVASAFVTAAAEGIANSIIKNGGVD